MKDLIAYDLSIYQNCCCISITHIENKITQSYMMSSKCNEFNKFVMFISSFRGTMVGFNNLTIAYPILHNILQDMNGYERFDGNTLSMMFNDRQQMILASEFPIRIPKKDEVVKQFDMALLFGLNNINRLTTLSEVKFYLRLNDIPPNPFAQQGYVTEFEEVRKYTESKSKAIASMYDLSLGIVPYDTDLYDEYKSINQMYIRNEIYDNFKISCSNLPGLKIGERILLTLYKRATTVDSYTLKQNTNTYEEIQLSECLPDFHKKITNESFLSFIEKIKRTYVSEKIRFSHSVIFKDTEITFGLGGAHSVTKPGIYESKEGEVILSFDVSSLYPSMIRYLSLVPSHMLNCFIGIYDRIIKYRLYYGIKNESLSKVLKDALNACYGKSNESHSAFFDTKFTYSTTIASQCFMCLWLQSIEEYIKRIIFINSDGIEIVANLRDAKKIYGICSELSDTFGFVMKDCVYDRIIAKDVNNYIAVSSKNKMIGCFSLSKSIHKDSSFMIIPIALNEYFIKGIPVSVTIRNHKDMFDFCTMINPSDNAIILSRYNVKTKEYDCLKYYDSIRIYISKNGYKADKIKSGKGIKDVLCSPYISVSEENDIDYDFYIKKCTDIINSIEIKQMSLW